MTFTSRGNFFLIFLHLFICIPILSRWVLADSNPDATENDNKIHGPEFAEVLNAINQQNVQLEKLEQRVEDLADQISGFISQFSEFSKISSFLINNDKTSHVVPKIVELDPTEEKGGGESNVIGKKDITGNLEKNIKDIEGGGMASVTKFSSPFWNERFQFVSAVKLGSNPTCIHVLPFRDIEGLSKYIAIGDSFGRLSVVSRNGDVLSELLDLVVESAIAAVVSYLSVYKNESMVVTGHVNGEIVMHRIWEEPNGDDWNSVLVERIVKFDTVVDEASLSPVNILEVHPVGRKRYVLSVDLSGKITVFRENGSVYGVAIPSSKPLAFSKQRLLFLTEKGAGSLDLRTMKMREVSCEGLNNSAVEYYEFDAADRSKAYGITSEGDLIQVFLLGDIMNFKCRVRSKRKLDLKKPFAFQAIKGYLLIADSEKISVYNVSSPNYVRSGSPKLVFSTEISRITASLLNQHHVAATEGRLLTPVLGSDRDKLVILSLGNGYVGTYRSNLSLFKNEFSTMQWTSPVLFFILFLFGAWHFFAKKKDALISWGPDDPFNSTSIANGGAAPAGSGSGDNRSLNDTSRNEDVDLNGNAAAIRGPPRRYSSPNRYPGGSGIPYRPPHPDVNSLSVDPNYRAPQDLKYRGSNFESTAFPKRRVFVNNAGVDDNNT